MEKISFKDVDMAIQEVMSITNKLAKEKDESGGVLGEFIKTQTGAVTYLNNVANANKFSDNLREILFIAFFSLLWVLKKYNIEIPALKTDDLLENEKGIIEDMQTFFSNSENMNDEEKVNILLGKSFQNEMLLFYLTLFMDEEFEEKFCKDQEGDPGAVCYFAMRNMVEVLEKSK